MHGERGQHVKSRMGGAKLRGGTLLLPEVSEEEETIAHAMLGAHSSSFFVSTIQPLMQTNIYAERPEELQCKKAFAEAFGTLLCLSLYREEVEEDVV